ncbi:MAG: biopolymer transporter ExbD, partial [Candidatus Latescibacteria bacterium]|nr:biopolymer transporter ExbD [Candidatus Latescibacterota bacterium]
CDDLAVRQHDNRRKHYTLSMLNVMKTAVREPSLGFVGIGFTERKSLVQKRIKRILNTNYRMTTRLSFISVFVLILLGTSGIAVSCKKSIDKAEKRESKVIKPPTMELLLSKVERPDSSIIRLQHPDNIKVNSLRVILNSDTLAYGTDYSYDFRTGKLILLAEETWSPDADISIRYDTYEPEDVNRIIFELTEEGQKLILEAPVNGTDGREGARKIYEAQKKAYKEGYINRVILIRAPSDVDIDVHRYMQKIRKSSSGIDKTNSENSEQKQAKNYPLPKKQIVVDTTKQIVVELNKEGDILIEGQKVSYESFEAYLAQEKHERFLRSQPSTVLIKADVDIPHERVIQFMRLLRKQENESKNFEFELPEEFKQDDGNFLEKQNDGNAIDNRETLEYKTKERIRIPGSNSIQVGSGESIKRGTDQVLLNGISLKRGTDYTIDYETGIVMLLNEEAMDPKADLVIKYDEEN